MNHLTILDNVSIAIIVTDKYMGIKYMNNASEHLFSNSKNSLSNKQLGAVFAVRNNIIISQIYEAITHEKTSVARDLRIPLTNRELLRVDCHVSVFYEKKEKNILIELYKINEQKKHYEDAELDESDNATKIITRSIAHEIKNPLGGIRGAAQLLNDELSDSQKEYTNIIIEETDRLKRYVDSMVGPSQEPNKESTNIHKIINHVLNLMASDSRVQTSLIKDFDPSIPEINIDKEMLTQALINVIKNAIEASDNKGKVLIRTRIGLKQNAIMKAIIEIIDEGPGVHEKLKQKVFLPLVTDKKIGTGLGLSITQRLLKLNDSYIEYENNRVGATFRIVLPMRNQ